MLNMVNEKFSFLNWWALSIFSVDMLSHNLLLKPGYSQNTGESFHNDGRLESLDKRLLESDL